MKAIISKITLTAAIVAVISLSVQAAAPFQQMKSDTGKMKMDKMKKMDKKMSKKGEKKMAKDTGKMNKM